ncbi:MAG: hypothetical protein JW917_06780 [Ignavibacteria bacterium]|nr:hypothetical protein [Ignavibacteria bacterium]
MILRNELKHLQSIKGYPCLSILMPTHRHHPENQQDAIRLKNLVNEAKKRLSAELKEEEANKITSKLNDLISKIDFTHVLDGLGLFVDKTHSYKFILPFPVKERVMLDDTFGTRDIVFGMNRSEPYWVLVLSEKTSKLYLGIRDNLLEYTDNGFPVINPFYELKTPPENGESRNDRLTENVQRLKNYFKDIDSKLKAINTDVYEITLMGAEKNLSIYKEVSSQTEQIILGINGNYEIESAAEISRIVWQQFKQARMEKREKILKQLDDAMGAKKLATGIDEVWKLSLQNRGRLLAVELNYHYPAKISEDKLHLIPTDVIEGKEVLDDAVDDIIEHVIISGGRVVFLDNSKLEKYGRIAMILRY